MTTHLNNTMALIKSVALYNECKIVYKLIMNNFFLSKLDAFAEPGQIVSAIPFVILRNNRHTLPTCSLVIVAKNLDELTTYLSCIIKILIVIGLLK